MYVEYIGKANVRELSSYGRNQFNSESGTLKLDPRSSTLLIKTIQFVEPQVTSRFTGLKVELQFLRINNSGNVLDVYSGWRDTHSAEESLDYLPPLSGKKIVKLAKKIIREHQMREKAQEEARVEECKRAEILTHTIPFVVVTTETAPRELVGVR
ncbi:hypothetical protein A3C59_02070 [Candidatus Daviesbacteria bacterium RIFCSPHIGHO2_02_FULL_36_13]|uniref:Uncharacterized protein n=1 Tax=Candidatus Daviesbacteria bacterium RIFCSPHIGHO2_02_FULL_36_13 TaxID=1797768 RepID=A0A1F5JV91_9BACT|nr:MAG: hypothetical protein A3C59_02070 [Candidatus Daviesbacteria bacterium RIFCSPHIGHO2_02_FULL_36_13]OGE41077.1 MAG: hypothetical protein A3A45_00165 [Candidatus Daviesbacteria bacterium RIFCSPLOWO2_01_FULL_36_8]